MNALVTGELLINTDLKLVFSGAGIQMKLYVKGEGDDWQWIRYVKSMNLRVDPNQSEHIILDIEVAVLKAEGSLIAQPATA